MKRKKQKHNRIITFLLSIMMVLGIINCPVNSMSVRAADGVDLPDVSVSYSTRINKYDWLLGWKRDGVMSGTINMSKYITAIKVKVEGNPNLGIKYIAGIYEGEPAEDLEGETYFSAIEGTEQWTTGGKDGTIIGAENDDNALEFIQLRLTGSDADKYDIYYSSYIRSYGWLSWAKNGEPSGSSGYGKEMEAVKIIVTKKGQSGPKNDGTYALSYIKKGNMDTEFIQPVSVNDDTIVLKERNNCEFKINDGSWQTSPIFAGLQKDTEYNVYYRFTIEDEDWGQHDESTEPVKIQTTGQKDQLDCLEIKNNGTRIPDKKLVFDEITEFSEFSYNLTVDGYPDLSAGDFVWSSSDESIVTVKNGYAELQGKHGTAVITVSDMDKKLTGSIELIVVPDKNDKLTEVGVEEVGTDYIFLKSLSGCVYTMDQKIWWSSPCFYNLEPDTEYVFYVKRLGGGVFDTEPVKIVAKTSKKPGSSNPTPNTPIPQPTVTPNVNVSYHTHIQTYGDKKGVQTNGQMAGTSGEAKRLESIWVKVESADKSKPVDLGIQYTTHCQTYGWLPWSANGENNGTTGESKRLEAIKIRLTGADKDKYDVYYRVHAQSYGWLGWAKNGEPSGTAGYGKRLEGIQVVVLKKVNGKTIAPGLNAYGINANATPHDNRPYVAKTNGTITIPGDESAPNVMYKTHVQSFGWQKWMTNGQMSGTSGMAKRLEGINIKLSNCPYSGGIKYRTHVQSYGWQSWKTDGAMAGTSGEAKRLEAIQIELTGEMAKHYDVYYRVHAQSFGWLGWAKNGAESGTAGLSKRLEGIQIVLVPKGGKAPETTYQNITSVKTQAYIKK